MRFLQLILFRLPGRRHRVGFFRHLGQFLFQPDEAFLRRDVAFLGQRHFLDFQLDDPAVQFVQHFRFAIHLHAQTRAGLVHQVDGLVGQEPVGDVTIRQRRRGDKRAIGDPHTVMQFVFILNSAQDRDRVLNRRFAHEDRLKPPRQRRVFFHMLAIFVQRGRADAMQRAPRQFGLDQIGRIHRAVRLARANQRVHFVDEQDDLAVRGLDFLQHGFQAFLELAAVFRSGDHRAEVQRQQLLVLQRLRHVAVDDAQGEALDNRGFPDTGLADKNGVVLGAAGQNLDGAAYLLVAADDRVEFPFARDFRDVAGVFLQRLEPRLGVLAIDFAAFAHVGDGFVERLRGGPRGFQRLARRRVRRRQSNQQSVLRDIFVARLGRRLMRRVKDAHKFRRDLRLARAAALYFRHLGDFGLNRRLRGFGLATGGTNEAGGRAFLVVQQRLEQMFRPDPLVELADGDSAGRLQKSAGALGEFLDVHSYVPFRRRQPGHTPTQAMQSRL